MLYVTTREHFDAFTAHRTLLSDRGPDGGLYLPFRMPSLDKEDLLGLANKSFSRNVSDMLNMFFSCRLTGWDVELCTGRYPLRSVSLNRKILVGESWHNIDWDYRRLEHALSERICLSAGVENKECSWVRIAVRMAVLLAQYGDLVKNGFLAPDDVFDIAVPVGDMSVLVSVIYCKMMGLPVGRIICACNENSALWELIHLGDMRTDQQAVKTVTPLADYGIPPELERLIHAYFSREEALRYCCSFEEKTQYVLSPDKQERLQKDLYSAVVSGSRVSALISSEYATSGYILGPYTALAYGGLMDYRARTGQSRPAVILADRSPVCDAGLTAESLSMSEDALTRMVQSG